MKKTVFLLIFLCFIGVFSEDATIVDTNTTSDTTEENSQLKEMLFSLFKAQENYHRERSFDNAVMFSPNKIKRQHSFGNDLFNWTDVLQQNPNFVSVYYSPDFPMNRALFRGYLIPTESHFLDRLYSPALPQYNRDLLEVKEIEILPDGTIHSELFNQKTITPDVFFAWQGGLFDGNMLKFRMLRNLSKTLSMNAFVSYSDLKRNIFHHGGGMAPMYVDFYNGDSTKTSVFGYNPLSHYNKSGMELKYQDKISANLRYSYSDIRQDLAYHTDSALQNDTLKLSIAYNEHNAFLHQLDGGFEIPVGEKFLWKNLGKLESVFQREHPISITKNGNPATESSEQNNTIQSAGSQFFFAPVPSDSISIQVSANRHIYDIINDTVTVWHNTKVIVENKFIPQNFDNFSAKINGGYQFIRSNGSKITGKPVYSGEFDLKIENFTTQLWGKYDEILFYRYFGFGANLHYQFPVLSIHGGYSNVFQDPDDNFTYIFSNYQPYAYNPQNVWSAGLSLGQIGPFSMFSNWFISDELPFLKSYSGIRFHFNKDNKVRHFYTDITYNYWSERGYKTGYIEKTQDGESLYLGNYLYWNRAIHDISLKFAAEIETFRLFWKIDNILNRTNSYVPGYIMPGLIFRWGFSWNIMG